MTVAFIGSDNYTQTSLLAIRMWEVVANLVVEEGADVFLFSNANFYEHICWEIVSQLKMNYSNIERHYHHGGFDYDIGYVDYLKEFYDNLFFPKMGVPLPRYLRNRAMIDKCDVLITYCSNEELHAEQKSLTALAIVYAREKNKRVVNLFY